MKNTYLYGIIAILVIILYFQNCKGNDTSEPIKITVPEVKGKFGPQQPKHESIIIDPAKNNLIKANSPQLENPINEKLISQNDFLAKQYLQAKDSLTKYKLYQDAIKLQNFTSEFEDDNIKLNISGIIRGEVQNITPDYTIKSKAIEVPKQKEIVFRMVAGVEIGNTTQFNNLNTKVNLGFQNRKGNIISISADTEQRFYLGYTASIFSIKGK